METIPLSLLPYFLLLLTSSPLVLSIGLPCTASGTTCPALLSFVPKTPTNLSTIMTTFQVKNYGALLGANAWELSLPHNTTIAEDVIVKVPITCFCNNGSGSSKDGPIYTVTAVDTLSSIAGERYGGLLNYLDIVDVNSQIKDANKIQAGQKFRIPLPCSCQSEREAKTTAKGSLSSAMVHYSYVVQSGNTLDGIAGEMGSSTSELMRVNNITDPTIMAAGQILDIPLKACSTNISKSSRDMNLLVANVTYVMTAGNCLQCSCGPSDLDLYCAPAPLAASCPSMQCKNSNLTIGNLTTQQIKGGCNVTECSYNGYVNGKILTTLETSLQRQCPAKHFLPALTTPSTLQAPAPAPVPLSPSSSPSPGLPSSSPSSSPAPGLPSSSPGSSPPNGLPSSPPNGLSSSPPSPPPAGSTNSMAAEPFKSLSLATMLVVGIPFLIHFGEY